VLLPVSVRYRLLDPAQYAPPEDHNALGDDIYVAPDENGLDALETQGIVDVIDWDYDGDERDVETLTGPPEPVVREDGTVAIVRPDDDGTAIDAYNLGEWVCQRCGTTTKAPVVNGEIQPPHECSNCERQGPFEQRGLADRPDISASTYADPQWYTPNTVDGEGYTELWDDVRDWLYTNWVTDEEHYYDGLTAFAIATWLRPNLNFLPQLMVMGKHETGKTQLLTTLARVGYRSRVPVSFTPAAIFRTIDKYDITLFLSEYHDLNPDLRDEINAVIKGSQKRGEDVMRTEKGPDGGYEPANFDIFTHVAIGTQFDPPDDIISRCIQVQTKPADRDVPVWFDEDRAQALRNRLLYARYRLLDSDEWAAAEQAALEWLNDLGISGRLREKLLSLATVAELWDKRDAFEPFVETMQSEAAEAAEDSDDAYVIRAIRDLALEEIRSQNVLGDSDPWDGVAIPVSDVCERFNDMTGRDVGPSYIGQVRKRLDLDKARRSDGVVIHDEDLQTKLEELCEQNNLPWEHSGRHDPVQELDEHETGHGTCSECGQDTTLTHRHAIDGYHMCRGCAAALEEAANE